MAQLSSALRLPKEPQKLGQILLKHTSLKEAQLTEALRIQKEEGGLLGQILVRKNFIQQHEIMRALCVQLGLPFMDDLKPADIDAKLVTNIPINYAKTKEAIPVLKEITLGLSIGSLNLASPG